MEIENRNAVFCRRAAHLALATLMALPATHTTAGERQQPVPWETFVQLEAGAKVVLLLRDDRYVAGRVLRADTHEAIVVDFTGCAFSDGEQKSFVRRLARERAASGASSAAGEQVDPGGTPRVQRVAREDVVVALHVRRSGSPVLGALKAGALAACGFVLVLLTLYTATAPRD